MKVPPEKAKKAAVDETLQEDARRRRVRDILRFEGRLPWEGDLEKLRRRNKS